jgi:hypothetical protein
MTGGPWRDWIASTRPRCETGNTPPKPRPEPGTPW